MISKIEPLEPLLWFSRIDKLLDRLNSASGQTSEATVRHAMHLLQLAPRPLSGTLQFSVNEEAVERMLECEAFVSAVLLLLASPLRFTLRQKNSGQFAASVECPMSRAVGKGSSFFAEQALLIAWSRFLLELRVQPELSTDQPPRIWQSAQLQHSTEH